MDTARGVPVLGMVGGGQLARMTHQAVIGLGIELRILAEPDVMSASSVAAGARPGSWSSLEDLLGFADGCDVVTFDHELTDPAHLAALEQAGHVLRPTASAERFAQDKAHQRSSLGAAGFPVPAHVLDPDDDRLVVFGERHGWPVVVKAARGGYDGRGVWVCQEVEQAREVLARLRTAGTSALVEEHVAIATEVAVAVARRPGGEQVRYAVTETVQRDGICVELVVPAPVDDEIAAAATELAGRLVEHVDGTGLVAVELFVTTDGHLLLNELALRPHNSVHWTIEGARTSQFQNHARATLDLPLGDVSLTGPAVCTVNVLGPADGSDPRVRIAEGLATPDVAVHLYGKAPRAGRKLGHVTVVGDHPATVRTTARRAAAALTGEESS